MKWKLTRTLLSLLLTAALLLTMLPGAVAVPAGQKWEKIASKRADNLLSHDEAVESAETSYAPDEIIRVSIVLEDEPAIALYQVADIGVDAAANAYRRELRSNQLSVEKAISAQVLGGKPLDRVWNLTLAANLISANVPYGQIEEIAGLPGVQAVVPEARYEAAVYEKSETANPNMATSQDMIGSPAAYASGYNGAGSRVAVIDTGTDTDHEAFNAEAFSYAIEQDSRRSGQVYDLLDQAEVEALLPQLNISGGGITGQALYQNAKLPFAYNYIDKSFDVTHDHDGQGEHGSHVAGIAAANRYVQREDGSFVPALEQTMVQGVAPDAQLLTMKVFGKNGGAYESDYMAAIEDAIVLGCDAINLSLGSSNPGFVTSTYYEDLLNSVQQTGVVLTISAGNAGTWADNAWKGSLRAESVSFDMVGSPSSYASSLSVVSADNTGRTGHYLQVGGQMVFYNQSIYSNLPMAEIGGDSPLEYILIDTVGIPEDWTEIDLKGKVALCSRGETAFSDKANAAAALGAAAVIIYNNEPGNLNMDLSGYQYTAPCVSISQEDAQLFIQHARDSFQQEIDYLQDGWYPTKKTVTYYTGEMTVSDSPVVQHNQQPAAMSSFSSWGVPGDLSLKPEITAPGGNIYSVNGLVPGGKAYETMSGTSMAAPQVAGMVALVSQYIRENRLAEKTGLSPRQLAHSLLMSTAQPLVDGQSGMYYPVIQQGAGLADVGQAISANSWITVDGQPDGKVKAELGDDPDRLGVYRFSFTAHNLTDSDQVYDLSAELFTQALFEDYVDQHAEWNAEEEARMDVYLSQKTQPLMASAVWQVNGKTLCNVDLRDMDFNADGAVDGGDCDAILDLVTGRRQRLSNQENADLNGDGAITSHDALLFLEKVNAGALLLPAGGKATVTVTLTLTEDQKKELDENNENGAYVQGYVTLRPVASPEGLLLTTHSIPVLAYYGNWSDPSMFDFENYFTMSVSGLPHRNYMDAPTNLLTYSIAGKDGSYIWGGDPFGNNYEYYPERAAFNNVTGQMFRQYLINPIRNAGAGKVIVTNAETGEVYLERRLDRVRGGFYVAAAGSWYSKQQDILVNWGGTDAQGNRLPEGTRFNITTVLAPEYYVDRQTGRVDWDALGRGAYLTTTGVIDNTPPEVVDVDVALTTDKKCKITITAKDNQFVSSAASYNPIDTVGYRPIRFQQTEAGTEATGVCLMVYVSGPYFEFVITDYAGNTATYRVDLRQYPDVAHMIEDNDETNEINTSFMNQWLSFPTDPESETAHPDRSSGGMVYVAAANALGLVYAAGEDRSLYVIPEDDLDGYQRICGLDVDLVDMAFAPDTGILYGLTAEKRLVELDKRTGAMRELASVGLDTRTLAADDAGKFYSLETATGDLYVYTSATASQPVLVGATGHPMSDAPQGFDWNVNDRMLYWTCLYDGGDGYIDWYDCVSFNRIDPATAQTTEIYNWFDTPMPALWVKDMDRTQEPDWANPQAEVEMVRLLRDELSLMAGESVALDASVLPWMVENREVLWTSSDPRVATVEGGIVTAIGGGSCVITAASAADPAKTASCQVQVTDLQVQIQGVSVDYDGTSTPFTWISGPQGPDCQWGEAMEMTVRAAAYHTGSASAYVQGDDDYLTLYRVDPVTGETLGSFGPTKSGIGVDDLTMCNEIMADQRLAAGIYYSLFAVPDAVEEGSIFPEGGYVDLGMYLDYETGASTFLALTSAGPAQVQISETETCDGELFLALDEKGYLWNMKLYQDTPGHWVVSIDVINPTTLGEQLHLIDGGSAHCSLTAEPETGRLFYSYFNGESADLYVLLPTDDGVYRAARLGGLDEDTKYAVLFTGESLVESSQEAQGFELVGPQAISPQITLDFSGETLTMEKGNQTLPEGLLNVADNELRPNSTGTGTENLLVVELTAKDAQGRDVTTRNGLATVNYDDSALALRSVWTAASHDSIRQDDGSVVIAWASMAAIPAEKPVATLVFERLGERSSVQVEHLQVNEAESGYSETLGRWSCSGGAACPSSRFGDVDASLWYHEALDYVVERELMQGVETNRFAPNGITTRAQVVQVLYRLSGETIDSRETVFADVAESAWYAEAVAWAVDRGVTFGTSQATFSPNAPATREQILTMLYRYAGQEADPGDHLAAFPDAGKISGWARDAANWAAGNGYVQGDHRHMLNPTNDMTRAELAQVLYNYETK